MATACSRLYGEGGCEEISSLMVSVQTSRDLQRIQTNPPLAYEREGDRAASCEAGHEPAGESQRALGSRPVPPQPGDRVWQAQETSRDDDSSGDDGRAQRDGLDSTTQV